MPLQATSGAASYDAFGGGVAAVPNYIEDVFQTWLYTGNGSTQTINNGIDLAGKGGLVWSKNRTQVDHNRLYDTVRGTNNVLISNSTSAALTDSNTVTAFNSNGYSIGTSGNVNFNGDNFVSWTFREQPKFFDVVTTTSQTFSHLLASVPGCVIWKRTDASEDWNVVSRRADGSYVQLNLNLTDGAFASYANAAAAGLTSTTVTLPSFSTGGTYVAYLFAHNAGGFGLTGTDNVISCGSYVGNSTTPPTIDLGWEPQWILLKDASASGADARFNWTIVDNMRGLVAGRTSDQAQLFANTSDAEDSGTFAQVAGITATGFVAGGQRNTTGNTYIYIAIRRGPMRTPTTGTSVFAPVASGNNVTVSGTLGFTTNIVTDLLIRKGKSSGTNGFTIDRLRGGTIFVSTNLANAEAATLWNFASQTGVILDSTGNQSGLCGWAFRRAPGFFDEVCYTGTGVAGQTYSHNLAVKPQLMLVKNRSGATEWTVYSEPTAATNYLVLNQIAASQAASNRWNNTEPTASVFSVGTSGNVNGSGSTYVAYLFASCPGVSKVGSYTGTGASRTIDCGFTGGARFVLIKRTDSTSGWYLWDSARGISASADPYLFLNNLDPEVTTTNWVDTASTGFRLTGAVDDEVNLLNASFIFLAIA